jgi:hypothetical protein
MATIRLYTQGNKWQYHARKELDPHFFMFLNDLKEASGPLPDELEMESSLADILETQWEPYLRLHRTCKEIDIDAILGSEGITQIYMPTTGQKKDNKQKYHRDFDYNAFPHVHSVSHILLLVDPLPMYYMFLRVDENVSKENRINHLEKVGRAMYDVGIRVHTYLHAEYLHPIRMNKLLLGELRDEAVVPCFPSTAVQVDRFLRDYVLHYIISIEKNKKRNNEELIECINIVILALVHNVRISRKDYGLYDILWCDLKNLVDRILSPNILSQYPYENSILNLADLVLGKSPIGHITYLMRVKPVVVKIRPEKSGVGYIIPYSHISQWGTLYHNLLPLVKDNAGSTLAGFLSLGLDSVMWNFRGIHNYPEANPYQFIGDVHTALISNFMHNLPRITEEDRYRVPTYREMHDETTSSRLEPKLAEGEMAHLVRFLACTFIGKEGLHRISQLIHSYVGSNHPSTCDCEVCTMFVKNDSKRRDTFSTFVGLIDTFLANPTDEWLPMSNGMYDLNEIRRVMIEKMS